MERPGLGPPGRAGKRNNKATRNKSEGQQVGKKKIIYLIYEEYCFWVVDCSSASCSTKPFLLPLTKSSLNALRKNEKQLAFPYLRLRVCNETAPSENTAWTSACGAFKEIKPELGFPCISTTDKCKANQFSKIERFELYSKFSFQND